MVKLSNNKTFISLGIVGASLALAFAPIPGVKQTITVVSGSELKEPLQELERRFERDNSGIDLELKFQGSQDMVNNYIERQNDFEPTILIPANAETLQELDSRWRSQNNSEAFAGSTQAISKTVLVAIAWQERGEALFPDGKFSWSRIALAMERKNWSKSGGKSDWGSFDFVITNPTRSNSGQLALGLWLESDNYDFDSAAATSLISSVKGSVYQPPRSTDILLQEFITRGANDADIAIVYESIALYRWSQAKTTQGQPYRLYYPNPTVETIATAAVMKNASKSEIKAANRFIEYLRQPEQQEVLVGYGFRPAIDGIDISSVANSPWSQNIPGSMPNLDVKIQKPFPTSEIAEIQRVWTQSP